MDCQFLQPNLYILRKVSDQIITWLNTEITSTKQKGFVVGVSGGIDSALVSTLCALTGHPTFAVSIPIHQGRTEHKRCEKHLEWLTERFSNVLVKTADLTSILDSYREYIHSVDLKTHDDLVSANLQSRFRMMTLYAFANAYGFLVAGTGNRVEDHGVGFFTKYGDGGVDISPIGSLLKSQVRELAAFLGVQEEIVKATPTDGLWTDGRSDEDQIGATYDELEAAMALHGRITCFVGKTFEDKLKHADLTERQQEVMMIYHNRHEANQHKMKMPPVCWVSKEYL